MDWRALYEEYYYFIRIVVIVAGALGVERILRAVLTRYIKRESARLSIDPTGYNFVKNGLSFIIFLFAAFSIIYTIPAFKHIAVTLFAGAGIVAIVIGLAAQTAFANVINGFLLVLSRPFRIGDMIQIGAEADYMGTVEDITLRHTVIRNFENERVIIPNSVVSSQVIINRSIVDERMIRFFEVGISYSSDINKAISIIQSEAEKHPLFIDGRSEQEILDRAPKVVVRVMKLGQYSIDLRAYIWGKNSGESFTLLTDLNKSIKERFDREGVEIPFPYQNIIFKNSPAGIST